MFGNADGDIRAALQILASDEEFAPPDQEIITALRAKHPPAPDDQLLPPPLTDTDPAPLTASETDVEAAINSMRPGSVAGLDGVRALHLQQLISREAAESGRRLIRSLTRLTNLLLQGAAPECAREALFGASLCAMRKGDGGLRPIAIGSIYRRLACRIAARHVATTVGEELRPVQLGVGTPQGCEAAVHATREYLAVAAAAGSPHLLVKVDVRNAFNTVRRDAFLSQVKARAPAVYPLLRNTYSEPTQLCIGGQTIASCSGVQQGDPLGPAAFALALDPVIRTMISPLNVWYLDDGTIGGPAELVAADMAALAAALPGIGLELNTKKCEVVLAGPAPPPQVLATLRATLPQLQETQPSDLSLLGSPLTDVALPTATTRAAATIDRMCARIRRLDAHTGLYLLAHYTAAPRLTYLLRSAPLYREPGPLLAVDRTVRSTLAAVTNVDIDDGVGTGLPTSEARWPGGTVGSGLGIALPSGISPRLATSDAADTQLPRSLPTNASAPSSPCQCSRKPRWDRPTGAHVGRRQAARMGRGVREEDPGASSRWDQPGDPSSPPRRRRAAHCRLGSSPTRDKPGSSP